MLEKDADPRLTAFVVWLPKHGGHEADVADAESRIRDPRASQWWDASGATMSLFDGAMKLGQPAWDVYLVYPPGVRWDAAAPPPPSFWMHQLESEPDDRFLDGAALLRAVESISSPGAASPAPPAPLPSSPP